MSSKLDRREFVKSSAIAGAGLMMAANAKAQDAPARNPDDIHVGLIGAGAQGQVLMNAILSGMPDANVKFRAVCDIWEQGNLRRVSRTLNAYRRVGHIGTAYTDYQEMLDNEDLDAVIVATPDFWHAEHTIAALKKGLHVYCEKEMSNDLAKAKEMVLTARETGKLLQIGHQRRSNPIYHYCLENVINGDNLLNRITNIYGQWHRSRAACEDLGWPQGTDIDPATLNKYGYKDMTTFRNWRWYKGLGGGPIVDLGSHQIDVYSWFLNGALPRSVMASGGTDYWKNHEWYDNVIAVYEFETEQGIVRASYQTLTTNSSNGFYEQFMGDEGTLITSEASGRTELYRERWVNEEKWEPAVRAGKISLVKAAPAPAADSASADTVDVRESPVPARYAVPVSMEVPYHQPHLVNFFDSIRGRAELNCPGEVGYETAVMVLKVNEAVAEGRKLEFKPEDFHV